MKSHFGKFCVGSQNLGFKQLVQKIEAKYQQLEAEDHKAEPGEKVEPLLVAELLERMSEEFDGQTLAGLKARLEKARLGHFENEREFATVYEGLLKDQERQLKLRLEKEQAGKK